MTDCGYKEQIKAARIGNLVALAPNYVRAFGMMLMLVAFALGGCSENGGGGTMSVPDRSTVRGLAQYVLWTFQTDSIEEFEKTNPPMELVEEWVGKGNPDWPMVAAMARGTRKRSLNGKR